MSTQATAKLAIKNWEEAPYHEIEGGPKLVRASVTQSYSGDIEGEGTLIYLMAYLETGTVPTMALERVVGKLGGREGSFVLSHSGSYENNSARSTFNVVPDSATGDLKGLRGKGTFVFPEGAESGTVDLEYDLA